MSSYAPRQKYQPATALKLSKTTLKFQIRIPFNSNAAIAKPDA